MPAAESSPEHLLFDLNSLRRLGSESALDRPAVALDHPVVDVALRDRNALAVPHVFDVERLVAERALHGIAVQRADLHPHPLFLDAVGELGADGVGMPRLAIAEGSDELWPATNRLLLRVPELRIAARVDCVEP